eukprot:m.306756 g.306756  ORF g.306756 m.306756 type:complete len:75 (+) comp41563_c0_seq1:509-733(+)
MNIYCRLQLTIKLEKSNWDNQMNFLLKERKKLERYVFGFRCAMLKANWCCLFGFAFRFGIKNLELLPIVTPCCA